MAITAEDLKKLSPRVKAVLVISACLLIGYVYYFMYLQTTLEKKDNLQSQLVELQKDVEAKQAIAAQKEKYERELKTLRETFKVALTKLPDKKEIPGLIEAVSMAGRNSDIDFLLFEPLPVAPVINAGQDEAKGAVDEKFYSDIPIKVKISGSYQNTFEFFDKVSKLPRIINVEDLTLGDRKESKTGEENVITSCTIKTYMFVDKVVSQETEKGNDNVQAKQ